MPLWIVGTPIGTLADLSPRARRVLAEAAVIAAEDTRVTRKLLSAHDIAAPQMVALHAHNEAQRAGELVARALEEDVALVSDAGMPGVSDPGRFMVAAAHERGVEVRSVPGPSALTTALSAAGFGASPFFFAGFMPRKGRDGFAHTLFARPEVCVVFEAPTRVTDLVRRLALLDPEREACLCRELSKKFEEVLRKPLALLAADLESRSKVQGECVLVLGPGEKRVHVTEESARKDLKGIASLLGKRWGVSKSEAYRELVELERQREDS
jgi:16S rRNA (cytidine1402-2'-O)-methyltransferase